MFRSSHQAVLARLFAGILVVVLAGSPTLAAERKREKKQGEAARRAIDKQKDIAASLRSKAQQDPSSTLQKQIDELKADLQAEKDRHAAALVSLNKDLTAQTQANDKRRASRSQKAIAKAEDAHKDRVARLEKKIAELQARLDGSKPQADTSRPPADMSRPPADTSRPRR